MKRYPVYKALYKPLMVLGVPLVMLVAEAAIAGLFIAFSWFLALPLVLIFHIAAMVALKQDPFLLEIMIDLSTFGRNR